LAAVASEEAIEVASNQEEAASGEGTEAASEIEEAEGASVAEAEGVIEVEEVDPEAASVVEGVVEALEQEAVPESLWSPMIGSRASSSTEGRTMLCAQRI
jgi:hypothetical protein